MKKLIFAIVSVLLFSISGFSQSVDLDRTYCDYAYRNLPDNPLALENRTYSVSLDAPTKVANVYDEDMLKNNFNLVGLQQLDQKGFLRFVVGSDDFRIEKFEIETFTHEKKDKAGKITRTYTYRAAMTYKFYAYYTIADTTGKAYVSTKPKPIYSASTYTSSEFKTSGEASQFIKLNRENIVENIMRDKMEEAVSAAVNKGNALFGYKELSDNMLFWFLGSKKHPEFELHQQVSIQVKELIAGISTDGGIQEAREVAKPIIEYLESVKGKYTEDNRKHRKMRYSSYYNLGMLYLALEQPDFAIAQANGLIENDYDTSDGRKIQRLADEMKKSFEINSIDTRHFEVILPTTESI